MAEGVSRSVDKVPRIEHRDDNPAIVAEKKRYGVRLSAAQEALWYEHQLDPNSPVYNFVLLSSLYGALDVGALEKALFAVVERHELLRSAILSQGGTPVLLPLKKWRGNLHYVELCHLGPAERDAEARRLVDEAAKKPFDLARDPLFRCVLVRAAEDQWLFLHCSPHMVFDGRSVSALYNDLAALYDAFLADAPPAVAELPFQFADFAAWQRRLLQGDYVTSLNEYWTRQLAGAENLELPCDFDLAAMHDYRGNRRYFNIPSDLLITATEFLRIAGTTAYRALCAAFNVFLCCHTGMEDICLGTPIAPKNPSCRGVENLIGHFVNTVVLRTNLAGDPSFLEVIRRADATVDGATAHSDLPLNKVVELLRSMRDPGRPLLMRSNFRALKQGFPALRLRGIRAARADYVDTGTSKFDLALEIEFASGKAFFEYRTALFREETIAQMEEDYVSLLRGLVARPDIPISQVPEVAEISNRARALKQESSSRRKGISS